MKLLEKLDMRWNKAGTYKSRCKKGGQKKRVRSLNLTNKYERKMKCQNQRSDPFFLFFGYNRR